MASPPKSVAEETLDRVRRIETRLTAHIIQSGGNTTSQKPTFTPGATRTCGGSIVVPSPHTSLKEMLDAIPPGYEGGPVNIRLGSDRVAVLTSLARLDRT